MKSFRFSQLWIAVFAAHIALGYVMSASVGYAGEATGKVHPRSSSAAEVTETAAFPLKASANNRYLVDQESMPFLMIGDAPQSLITNSLPTDAAMYMANRRSYGINTLWINLICKSNLGCNADATTIDGIAPFNTPGDLSSPNPAYFQRAEDMIKLAGENGIVVLLDPIETSGWLNDLQTNGVSKAFAYGQYLGRRYKDLPNIIWMHGNDFQSWQTSTDDEVVQAVARGIKSTDTNHIHTAELDYLSSGTLDDPTWTPLVELDAAYTYFPTYIQVLKEYNRQDFKPVFLVESNYEFEHLSHTDGGSAQNLRRQGYWALLSGAIGQIYGSAYTWPFKKDWQSNLDTQGVKELSYMKRVFAERRWYDLVPDQNHVVVTDGYGSFGDFVGRSAANMGEGYFGTKLRDFAKKLTGLGSITTNTYASAARTPDGALAMVYLPSIRTITVDMSKMAGPTRARWYDPTSGSLTEVSDNAFLNGGDRQFNPPGRNSVGDGDWLLLLEAHPAP